MAQQGEEPIGSMGTDTSLAALSDRPRLLYDYFKQSFAQVTNPPLDAIREELVTSMESTIGPEGNLLDPRPESCRQIKIKYPIIDNDQLAKLRHVYDPGFRTIRIPMLFDVREGGDSLERAMDDLNRRASDAVEAGYTILILSDRDADRERAPIPSLLATSGVHHHLVRQGTRTRCALVVETGDAREVHHCALLLGYGAGAVNPYLAFETLDDMVRQRILVSISHAQALKNYVKALNKGILKVMSKMGISTLQSYCGAQVFEAVGLDRPIRRQVLHANRVADRRRRHRRHRRGSAPAPPAGVSRQAGRSSTTSSGAASTSGGATASITCSTPTRSSSCSTRRGAASIRSSRSTRGWSTTRTRSSPRFAACSSCRTLRSRFRSRRSNRSNRSSSALRPARCRTARSVRKRTRRWRSP